MEISIGQPFFQCLALLVVALIFGCICIKLAQRAERADSERAPSIGLILGAVGSGIFWLAFGGMSIFRLKDIIWP